MGSTIHGPSSDIYFLKIYILGSLSIKFEAFNWEIRVMWMIFNFRSKCFFWTPFLAAVSPYFEFYWLVVLRQFLPSDWSNRRRFVYRRKFNQSEGRKRRQLDQSEAGPSIVIIKYVNKGSDVLKMWCNVSKNLKYL